MTGFEEATQAIAAGHARAHALWAILSDERQRDGYMIRPCPWEGPGEYQHVSYDDGREAYVKLEYPQRLRTMTATEALAYYRERESLSLGVSVSA